MVQTKFGLPVIAVRQMDVFTSAVLLATVAPPPPPRKAEWTAAMDFMGQARSTPLFVFDCWTPPCSTLFFDALITPDRRSNDTASGELRSVPGDGGP